MRVLWSLQFGGKSVGKQAGFCKTHWFNTSKHNRYKLCCKASSKIFFVTSNSEFLQCNSYKLGKWAAFKEFDWLFLAYKQVMGKAKGGSIFIRLVSAAGTGFFYVKRKNPRKVTEKLEFRKYDPRVNRHVLFTEAKMKNPLHTRAAIDQMLLKSVFVSMGRGEGDYCRTTPKLNAMVEVNRMKEALKLLEEMFLMGCTPDVNNFNDAIHSLCRLDHIHETAKLIDQMLISGFTPLTYQKLLKEEEITYCANQDKQHKVLPDTAATMY
ncbi:hypothetical protein HHK36_020705 [Tetracentron sinense]|uniref:Large ribosomal subunit protein bL33c n=1 Tax=Tetracentron sinense TaxID=13715 RepID=A0A834YXJ3_TETSI|nr:hypothetical protein HHK36_020705 [Tetracentron sinense]